MVKWNRSIGYNLDRYAAKKMKISERIFNGPDSYKWRKTFAIWPVRTISGKYVWLKTIYKQRYWAIWGDTGFHMEPEVEYAELFDVLTYDYDKS